MQEFGTQKSWLFCLKGCFRRKSKDECCNLLVSEEHENLTLKPYPNANDNVQGISIGGQIIEGQEDEDARTERVFVNSIGDNMAQFPLVSKDLRKIYNAVGGRPSHIAVKNLSLCIKPGEIFGLLGPNGAGKTTFIALITGIYPPSSGNAWVGGFDILSQMDQVHLNIGVCP